MHWFGIAFIGSVAGAMLLGILIQLGTILRQPRRKDLVEVPALILVMIGSAGCFAHALSCAGAFNWLPPSFEWPIGYASGILTMPDGTHVVPHEPSGRVQIYDRDWHFLRGWRVEAYGGVFKLLPAADGNIEVLTARGDHRYRFRPNGELIASDVYPPEDYSSFPDRGTSAFVPTPIWLWVFSDPFYSWCAAVVGGILLGVSYHKTGRMSRVNSSPTPSNE